MSNYKPNLTISDMPHSRANRTFMNYHVGVDGHLYNLDTGEKKYSWINIGRNSKYVRTQFYYEGKRINIYLHRVCALINLGDFEDCLEVNHINGDSLDNSYGNLNMSCRVENALDAQDRKRVSKVLRNTKCEFKYGHIKSYSPLTA